MYCDGIICGVVPSHEHFEALLAFLLAVEFPLFLRKTNVNAMQFVVQTEAIEVVEIKGVVAEKSF